MSDKKKKHKKKEKITYIDDGRSFADFSGSPLGKSNPYGMSSDFSGNKLKDSFKTYIESVKLMFLPMMVTLGGICVILLILWLLFGLK